jgi:M6 family metalloprotease-like protein
MPPTTGALRVAMLFVDFPDSPGTTQPGAIYQAHVPRVLDWYRTVSYGRLEIEVEPLPSWLRLPVALSEYQAHGFEGAIEAAVAMADPAFDFSSFDALYVIASMPSLASTIVDHEPIRVDGTAIHSWAWLATGSLQRLPFVAIHETGHLLGLPDLYVDRVPSSQHSWDVMTAAPRGGGLFAWHRWKLGWLDGDQIVCLARRGTVATTMKPIEEPGGTKTLISRLGRAAVVVEVRRRLHEDASICRSGVLVYRVDFVRGAPDNVGLRQKPIELHPARADDPKAWSRCGKEWRATLALGRGQVSRVTAWKHTITLLKRAVDGSYRVRVTRH